MKIPNRICFVGSPEAFAAIGPALARAGIPERVDPEGVATALGSGLALVVVDTREDVTMESIVAQAGGSPVVAVGPTDAAGVVASLEAGASDHVPVDEAERLTLVAKRELERSYERAELRERNWFLNGIIDAIPHIIFVKDAENLVTSVANEAYADLMATTKEELVGRTDYDLFPRDMADAFAEVDRGVLATQQIRRFEERVKVAAGHRWFGTTKVALVDDEGTSRFLIGITQDITDLKESRQALEAANEELTSTQSQLLTTLQQMAETQDAAVLGEQVADVARELRASSLGTLDWLETTLAKSPDADMDRAALEMVAGELRSIVATLGRFETRRDHRTPPTLPLTELVERAAKETREELGDHVAIRVNTTEATSVRGMEEELARSLADVMSYLLDEENEDDEVVVEVAVDDGIPVLRCTDPKRYMTPAERATLFSVRANASSVLALRRRIRLVMARRMLERNAGSIVVSSTRDRGTTLEARLCPA